MRWSGWACWTGWRWRRAWRGRPGGLCGAPLPAAGEGSLLNAPLSGRKHPLALVLDALRPGQVICAGMVGPQTAALAADRGLTLHDYFAREELAVAVAVPTALPVGHYPARREHTAPPRHAGGGLNC
ncbi:MAG: hypothetical protein ACLRIS_12720 [Flavonifractor plautii]